MRAVDLAKQTADSWGDYGVEWIYLAVPLLIGAAVISWLFATGEGKHPIGRVSSSLERLTGLPSFSAGGIGMGILALVVAVLGFYWDVAWHIELGRDEFIFTPAHLGIMLGLALIAAAGLTSIIFATYERFPTKIKVKGFHIPYGAIPVTLLGIGALIGFPLDEFWHRAYGIDVTMWGPTHLVMISGASLTPLALLLLHREGRDHGRPNWLGRELAGLLAAANVLGLSTWTGEFDFGVPQFQALYHPILVMGGSAMALVIARRLLGTGGALRAAVGALVLRGLIALVIGAGLGLVIPRFPLYIGSALVIELCFRLFKDWSSFAAATGTGVAVATLGYASEWAWMSVWGRHAWTMDLMPGALIACLVALAAVYLAWAIGDILTGARPSIPRPALIAAGAMLLIAIAAPLPRTDAAVHAVVTTEEVGGEARVQVALEPRDAADGADWFEVLAWQGGAVEVHPLVEKDRGVYTIDGTVPASGEWKTIVRLAKDDNIIATGVYLPADPEIGASEVPLEPRKDVELVRDTELLMREATGGPAWPAIVAWTAIAILALTWIAALVYSYASLAPDGAGGGRARVRPATA